MSENNGELRTDSVSRVYAEALFEMADAAGQEQEIADEVEQIGELLRSEAKLLKLMATPTIAAAQRRGIIERIFHGRVSDTVYRFLQVVAAKGRLASLPGIVQAYSNLVIERRGVVEVDVFVPSRLDADQLNEVATSIGKALGDKEVALHQYLDESLLGGMKVRIGDKLIDASVAAQLRALQQQMVERGQRTARRRSALE